MALNPRMVNTDTTVTWDGGTTVVPAGTIVDIPPGSALETAYGGVSNLTSLTGPQALAVSDGAAFVGVGSST